MFRVLQLIQKPQLRGAEVFACQLSYALERMGEQCKVLSVFGGDSKMPHGATVECLQGSTCSRMFDIKGWSKLAKVVRDFQPDLVQCNAGDTLKYAVLSRMLFRWKVPIIARNASVVSLYLKRRWTVEFNRFLYRNVDGVASVSHASARDLEALFRIDNSILKTIPIAIEDSAIGDMEFEGSGPHVVHVGGFTFEKNHRGLLRVWKQVLSVKPLAKLHLVGDGPLRGEVEAEVKASPLCGSVVFHGFQEKPLEFMKAADVLVLPSVIEGLPGVLLEAMSVETPVVAYDVGGVSEIVKDQETGCLVEAGNELEFAKAIDRTITFRNSRQIQNAKLLVESEFTLPVVARKFREFYQDVCERYSG